MYALDVRLSVSLTKNLSISPRQNLQSPRLQDRWFELLSAFAVAYAAHRLFNDHAPAQLVLEQLTKLLLSL